MNSKDTIRATENLAEIYHNRTEADTIADTVKKAAAEMGADTLAETLAALVCAKWYDGRIAKETKEKARDAFPHFNACNEYFQGADEIHPAHLEQIAAYMFAHFDEIKAAEGEKQPETVNAAQILEAIKDRLDEEPQTDDGADFVADYSASDSAYICDAFSEFADGRTSIYYSDIKKFMCENPDAVEDALNEFGFDGCGNDFYKLGQTAEFMQIERALYNDIYGIVQALAREYLANVILEQNYNGDKLADALDDLADTLENIDNNNRLDDIADAVNDFLKALTDEDGEE